MSGALGFNANYITKKENVGNHFKNLGKEAW
ncbi:Variable major outer membrane lipoprotein (plasmid) [Borrelia crocidurae DOU]|uniref:Variable major outer membrane lipoprotein n=1 Tax=Borrelia crocidurae DOU TaxID=1293575 RepID=W5SL26_9SPIR|nr:Variable major outer membrane lipoprotein [Borrelia crocidurae DOU]